MPDKRIKNAAAVNNAGEGLKGIGTGLTNHGSSLVVASQNFDGSLDKITNALSKSAEQLNNNATQFNNNVQNINQSINEFGNSVQGAVIIGGALIAAGGALTAGIYHGGKLVYRMTFPTLDEQYEDAVNAFNYCREAENNGYWIKGSKDCKSEEMKLQACREALANKPK